jgi:Tol biopolymer transport system component
MNIKRKGFFTTLCVISSFIVLSFSGCVDPVDEPVLPERGFFMGLLPMPSDNQDFQESYAQAAEFSECVPIWSSGTGAEGFWDYVDKLSGSWGKTFLNGYIRENGMFPLIHFSFMDKDASGNLILKTPDSLPDATLADESWRTLYKTSVLDVVDEIHPKYLSIGNEVNRWYEEYGISEGNPNGFQHFISLYNEIYDAVKSISSETIVFCVFSREIVNENKEADMTVLNLFDENKLDLLMITTYPYAVQGINLPSDIPSDYYQQVSDYFPSTPFGFSEIGWSSLDAFGGQQGQYDFLINLSTVLTKDLGINLHFFMYFSLHDLDEQDTVGLIKRDGTEKLGYDAWKAISDSTVLWRQQPNDKIVFISKADSENGELYLLDKDNTISRLTYNDRFENNPALSFDGKKIAFHAGDSSDMLSWEIYILDLETLQEKQITHNNVLDGHPDWSPDNKYIVYASFQDSQGNPAGVADLFIKDLNGTTVARLTDNEWEDNDPEWSPDGTHIAFKSTRHTQVDAREEIYVMNSDGTNTRRLTTTLNWESDHDPSWSPDSSTITYMHYAGVRPWTDIGDLNNFIDHWDELTPWNTYLVDLNGNSEQVTHSEYIAQLAVFSKDGKNILYLDNEFITNNNKLRGVNHRFTIIHQDGTNKKQLLPDDRHTPTVEYFDW